MKTKPVELLGIDWARSLRRALYGSFILLQPALLAADGPPLLDAPGPGYREQRARVMEPPVPAKLEPIHFMYPFMAPQPSFDGAAVDQPLLLRRGEFMRLDEHPGWDFRFPGEPAQPLPPPRGDLKVLSENPGWNFRVSEEPIPAPRLPAVPAIEPPLTAEDSLRLPPVSASAPQDIVRLPVIPEVILPVPKDVGEANESAQPFAEHLPLELRPR